MCRIAEAGPEFDAAADRHASRGAEAASKGFAETAGKLCYCNVLIEYSQLRHICRASIACLLQVKI